MNDKGSQSDDRSETSNRSLELFWEAYEEARDEIQEDVLEASRQIPEFEPALEARDDEDVAADQAESRRRERAAVLDGDWDIYAEHLREQGAMYARMGVPLHAWYELQDAFRESIHDVLFEAYGDDRDALRQAIAGMEKFLSVAMANLGTGYMDTQRSLIESQQQAIRELSTPVLEVDEHLLLLPIVGEIDTHRAKQLTEKLLHEIDERRARMVVMDITGVPVVDSRVASHFVETVDAADLMGAGVIITGVAPRLAQTLVSIGADLGDTPTVGDLRTGLNRARQLLKQSA